MKYFAILTATAALAFLAIYSIPRFAAAPGSHPPATDADRGAHISKRSEVDVEISRPAAPSRSPVATLDSGSHSSFGDLVFRDENGDRLLNAELWLSEGFSADSVKMDAKTSVKISAEVAQNRAWLQPFQRQYDYVLCKGEGLVPTVQQIPWEHLRQGIDVDVEVPALMCAEVAVGGDAQSFPSMRLTLRPVSGLGASRRAVSVPNDSGHGFWIAQQVVASLDADRRTVSVTPDALYEVSATSEDARFSLVAPYSTWAADKTISLLASARNHIVVHAYDSKHRPVEGGFIAAIGTSTGARDRARPQAGIAYISCDPQDTSVRLFGRGIGWELSRTQIDLTFVDHACQVDVAVNSVPGIRMRFDDSAASERVRAYKMGTDGNSRLVPTSWDGAHCFVALRHLNDAHFLGAVDIEGDAVHVLTCSPNSYDLRLQRECKQRHSEHAQSIVDNFIRDHPSGGVLHLDIDSGAGRGWLPLCSESAMSGKDLSESNLTRRCWRPEVKYRYRHESEKTWTQDFTPL